MGGFSITHWLILLVVVVIVFGTSKLKNAGKDLGGAVKGFKDAVKEEDKPKFDFKLIPLGISMQLPPGFEAVVVPRSSLFLNHGLLQTNHFGVIDNTYCGDTDEWKFPAMGFFNTEIIEGTRICQFRIQLSQKATILQKLKWLFNNKIELEYVDHLENIARDGFGSTNHSKL